MPCLSLAKRDRPGATYAKPPLSPGLWATTGSKIQQTEPELSEPITKYGAQSAGEIEFFYI